MLSEITDVALSLIETDNRRYSFSFRPLNSELCDSVSRWGVLKPLLLLKNSESFIPVTGFHRIMAAQNAALDKVPAQIMNSFDPEIFCKDLILRHQNREFAPSERIAIMFLLRQESVPESYSRTICVRGLSVPAEIHDDEAFVKIFNGLSKVVRTYFDARAIPFRLIQDFCSLPEYARESVENWIEICDIRINIFKTILEYLHDIVRRDADLSGIESFVPDGELQPREKEQALLEKLTEIRYPNYYRRITEAEALLKKLVPKGVDLHVSDYFSGGFIEVRSRLTKKATLDSLIGKLDSIDRELLGKLLDLL